MHKMPEANLFIQDRRENAKENIPINQRVTFNLYKYQSGNLGIEFVGRQQIYNFELAPTDVFRLIEAIGMRMGESYEQ